MPISDADRILTSPSALKEYATTFGGVQFAKAFIEFFELLFGNYATTWHNPLGLTDPDRVVRLVADFLLSSPDLGLYCDEDRVHQIVVWPDGRVEDVDHGLGDLETEAMLAGLAGAASPCLTAKMVLETGSAPGVEDDASFVRALSLLRVGMAWARLMPETVKSSEPPDPDADWIDPDPWDGWAWLASDEDRGVLISTLTTPDEWEPWRAAGVSVRKAKQFLIAGASLEQARPWLDANVTTKAAAASAVAGLTLTNDLSEWAAHGFNAVEAKRWISRVRCTPVQAATFRDGGMKPAWVHEALQVASVETLLAWMAAGFDMPTATDWIENRVSVADALEWHTDGVRAWMYRETGRCLAHLANPQGGYPDDNEALTAATRIDRDLMRRWLRVPGGDRVVPIVVATGADPEPFERFGGVPVLPPVRHRASLHNMQEVVKRFANQEEWSRWVQWVFGPLPPPAYHGDDVIDQVLAWQRFGIGPDLADVCPVDRAHKFLADGSASALIGWFAHLVNYESGPIRDMAARGWFCDDVVFLYLEAADPQEAAQVMVEEYRKDPVLHLSGLAEAIKGWEPTYDDER